MNAKLEIIKTHLGTVTYDNIVDLDWWNKLHEIAKKHKVLVVFPVSDDLLYTAGYDKYDYPGWEGTTLYVTDKEVTAITKTMKGRLLLTVTSVWVEKGDRAWELITTSRNATSFDILEDGEVWANGLIIDMDAEMAGE